MPRLRLPPLPPPTTWNNHFSRAKLAHAPDPSIHRNFPRRVTLTNRKLADEFVRALKIRPGEVVIETFGGAGQLTRSLLNGGNPENTVETAARWVKDKQDTETSKEPIKSDVVDFPTWRDELERHEPPSSEPLENGLPRPHIVVADEPSTDFLVRGLGMPQSQVPALLSRASVNPRGFKYPLGPGRSADIEGGHILESIALEQDPYPTEVYQSTIEPNLFFSPSTPYPWTTIPRILSHELVSSRLEKYNEEVKRPWSAPPPPITIVGQMPTSVIGDQLVAQWLTSVIGASFNGSTWIWDWGRIRFALIVPKNLYDRLMSKPRENARCKLSVLADALWDLTPLPPLHHVVNVDKSSKITVNRFVSRPGRHKTSAEIELTKLMAAEIENTPRTTTYPIDFWPNRHTTGPHSVEPFPRSPYLGLLLEPKETTVLLPEQKDAWDYVLRKCFVRESLPLRDSVQTLGFGADNLIPRFESTTDEFRGRPVDCAMVVRDLEVLDWARIVDVLHKWAFKPASLFLDATPPDEDLGRTFGHAI